MNCSKVGPFQTLLGLILAFSFGCTTVKDDEASQTRAVTYGAYATNFKDLGKPYGACGVPESVLESKNFLALNVQNTPRDYTSQLSRPIDDSTRVGAWDNGRNCGRWVRVVLDKTCVGGSNSGVVGKEFCEGGRFEEDAHTGATADFIVTDSCQDNNRWCRDDQFHIDIATSALSEFRKDGQKMTRINAQNWANPLVKWQYIDAPNYQGDIQIGFVDKAEVNWPAILITRLPRGIHGVEFDVNGTWKTARLNGDNGQIFILEGAKAPYRIRVYDAYDELLAGGRIYQFDFPCKGVCSTLYTQVKYSSSGGTPGGSTPQQAEVQLGLEYGNEEPSKPGKPPLSTGVLKAQLSLQNSWATGACYNIVINNPSSQVVRSWKLQIDTQGLVLDQNWNSTVAKEAKFYVVGPGTWSEQIAAGGKVDNLGFCVKGAQPVPRINSVSP